MLSVRAQPTTRDVRMQLGAYRVGGVLGEGASGIVYQAQAPSGHVVALKVLRPELALSEKERQRFLDEAERLRRVRHPALVEVIDAGVLPDGVPFIAMPYLQGASLADRLQRGPVPFDVALHLFEQLADALQMLHRAGLVHRDIKPENIFVVDGDRHALLLDLGIARDVTAAPSTTTHAGMIRGTPAYMAPERFFGAPATPATDIYELGVVLYLTLVGSLPWARFDDPTERMRPAPPAARGVVLPPRLSTTLMRALAVSPGERPQSAHEFASAVIDAMSPESAQAIAGAPTAYFPSRAPAAYAPTLHASASGIRATAQQQQQQPSFAAAAAPPAAPAPKKSSGLLFAAMTGASLFAAGIGVLVLVALPALRSPNATSSAPIAVAPPPVAQPAAAPTTTPLASQASASTDSLAANDVRTARSERKPKPVRDPVILGGKDKEITTNAGAGPLADGKGVQSDTKVRVPPPPAPSTFMDGSNCPTLIQYVCSDAYKRVKASAECFHWKQFVDEGNRVGNKSIEGMCQSELAQRTRAFDASTAK